MAKQRSGRRTDYEWTSFGTSALALAANGTAAVAFHTFLQTNTVYRIRGELLCWLDAGQAAGDVMRVGVGIQVGMEDIDTTVLTSPLADTDVPWMWSYFGHLAAESQTAGADLAGLSFARIPIDTKAMRRVKNQQVLQVVFETVTVGGAEVCNFAVAGRVLTGN